MALCLEVELCAAGPGAGVGITHAYEIGSLSVRVPRPITRGLPSEGDPEKQGKTLGGRYPHDQGLLQVFSAGQEQVWRLDPHNSTALRRELRDSCVLVLGSSSSGGCSSGYSIWIGLLM